MAQTDPTEQHINYYANGSKHETQNIKHTVTTPDNKKLINIKVY